MRGRLVVQEFPRRSSVSACVCMSIFQHVRPARYATPVTLEAGECYVMKREGDCCGTGISFLLYWSLLHLFLSLPFLPLV
ncbi:hypothetical protein E2C01_092157 [Portunus trituberculatus]|uniref:Uncharacterized protein n=1 Tax=Portunus trituberculatus TaxID=210409 RepID=A0A5B7JUQ6_PORTR|nr:hypothetical protein [Portunus trituberculatus]